MRCHCLVLSLLFILTVTSLHLNTHPTQSHLNSEKQDLEYLASLQNKYSQGIRKLNSEAETTQKQLNTSNTVEQKIKILQNAITAEKGKVNTLSNSIIPDSNSEIIQCQIINQQQQLQLNQQADDIQSSIKSLEAQITTLPECDQLTTMRTEISKLKVNLQRVQTIASNQCEQNLQRTLNVYQTNLYQNQNWTLGSYTMDQLIDEYFQNSLKYGNISNCPLSRPYMPSSSLSTSIGNCIRCPSTQPLFDVSSKKCISCPDPKMSLDLTTRKCGYPKRNTDYISGYNYRLQPLSQIPAPLPNLTYCQKQTPFFDNNTCVACQAPFNYWQISELKCYPCQGGLLFDSNLRKCTSKLDKELTRLNNTRWISENTERVWQQRQRILEINKTSGEYMLCNESNPYYDGIECIQCPNQFNIDNLTCTSAPPDTTYNRNIHRYLSKENKQTDPLADNYITSNNFTDDPNVPNCNSSYPFFDDSACVYCAYPYPIFNYDDKQCGVCPEGTLFNNQWHQCVPMDKIYVYGRRDRLLATARVSVQDYDNTLQRAVQQNPKKLPSQCQNDNEYATIDGCVVCDPDNGYFFNVQLLNCSYCDGVPDSVTNVCVPRKYYLVNSNAPNLLLPSDMTLLQLEYNNQKTVQSNPSIYSICPLEKPYPYDNRTICGRCPDTAPLYSVELQGCTSCVQGEVYDSNVHACRVIAYLTDYDSNVIIAAPLTLNGLLQQQERLNQTNITKKCPKSTPYSPDYRYCIDCLSAAPYFDVSKGICTECPYPLFYSAVQKGCYQIIYLTNLEAPRLLEMQNYTVENVRVQQREIQANKNNNVKMCPIETPYAQPSTCIDCSAPYNLFNLRTQTCEKCPYGLGYWEANRSCMSYVNITNFESPNARIIQSETAPIYNYMQEQEQLSLKSPTRPCPDDYPYALYGQCTSCPEYAFYFSLDTRSCTSCDNYQPNSHLCPPIAARYPNLTNYNWISNNADNYIQKALDFKRVGNGNVLKCPQFYNDNTKECVNCSEGQYYNDDTKTCEYCSGNLKFDINTHRCQQSLGQNTYFTNVKESPMDQEIYGGLTVDELYQTEEQLKISYPNAQFCPVDAPFYDGIRCIICPSYKKYFNLRYKLCQICMAGEYLSQNDCINSQGNKVWKEPSATILYQYLFSNF